MNVNWREMSQIAGAGALGGAVSIIYSITTGTPPVLAPFPFGVIAYAILGSVSALIGVYVLAKTDTTNHAIHCIVFSIVCGVFWAPIFDGASALVKNNRERAVNAKVVSKANEAKLAIQNLEKATDQQLPAAATSVVEKISDLLAIAPEATDRKVSISIAQSVDGAMNTLRTVKMKNPTVAKKATSEIMAAANASGFSGSPALMPFEWFQLPDSSEFAYGRDKRKDGGS